MVTTAITCDECRTTKNPKEMWFVLTFKAEGEYGLLIRTYVETHNISSVISYDICSLRCLFRKLTELFKTYDIREVMDGGETKTE